MDPREFWLAVTPPLRWCSTAEGMSGLIVTETIKNLYVKTMIRIVSIWPEIDSQRVKGRLWLKGGASVLLSEGRWLDSPWLHVKVSMSKILNPKLLLMCWWAPHIHQCMNVYMNYCQSFWTKASCKRRGKKKTHLNGRTNWTHSPPHDPLSCQHDMRIKLKME